MNFRFTLQDPGFLTAKLLGQVPGLEIRTAEGWLSLEGQASVLFLSEPLSIWK